MRSHGRRRLILGVLEAGDREQGEWRRCFGFKSGESLRIILDGLFLMVFVCDMFLSEVKNRVLLCRGFFGFVTFVIRLFDDARCYCCRFRDYH